MPKAFGYCRVSTTGQLGDDKYGLDAQRADIENYCQHNDIELVKMFEDHAVSGATDPMLREDFKQMVDSITEDIDIIIIPKSDRLSRDTIYGLVTVRDLQDKYNVDIISVDEGNILDNVDPYSKAMLAMRFSFSEIERHRIKDRLAGGRKVKASRGGYSGGKPPLGYKAQDKKLIVVEDEAEVVRLIFKLREDGLSLRKIVGVLVQDGIKNKKGNNFDSSQIHRILKREDFYKGGYRYGDVEADGWHEAIL